MIATEGYAVADEMLESGLIAIGAPLYNYDGRALAAISIFGPKNRLAEDTLSAKGELVRDMAVQISALLGYRPRQQVST